MVVCFVNTNPNTTSLVAMGNGRLLRGTSLIVCTNSLIGPRLLGCYGPRYAVVGDTAVALRRIVTTVIPTTRTNRLIMHLRANSPDICNTRHRRVSLLHDCGLSCRIIPNMDSFYTTTTYLGTRCALPGMDRSIVVAHVRNHAPIPDRRGVTSCTTRGTAVIVFLDDNVLRGLRARLMENNCEGSAPTTVICGTS